jgi:hypothetical protein
VRLRYRFFKIFLSTRRSILATVTDRLRVCYSHMTVLGGILIYTMLFCLALQVFLRAMQGGVGNHAGNRYRMPYMRCKFESVGST